MKNIGKEIILSLGISSVENLEFICERRKQGLIFFDVEKNVFIRFGLKKIIKKEFEIQIKFIDYGFCVPKIFFSKEVDDYFLYVEESLGKKSIGIEIGQKDISYKKGLSYLYNNLENFLISQKKTINNNGDLDELKINLNIDKFKNEVLDLDVFKVDFIDNLYEKIFDEIKEKGIYCLTHGDFNSRNIFKNGFIDVEDSYNGILGYDLISLITHLYWFEVNGKRSISFSFNVSDIKKVFELYNNNFSVKIEEIFSFLFLLRGIWACSGMGKFPEEQKYRFNRFKIYAEKYLKGENILKYFFEEVEKVNKIMKRILITGHSKGIGKYLFEDLKKQNEIFAFSRENNFDLTKIETFEKVKKNIGIEKLDILILNAGVGEFGSFEEIELEQMENIINLNLLANIRILKTLEKNIDKNTKIIFMGSIISKKFMKNASVYQASKFGLRGFAGGLKKEGKKVFLINPKIVDTDFHKNKVDLEKRFEDTSLVNILEIVNNIIFGNEEKFEIDL